MEDDDKSYILCVRCSEWKHPAEGSIKRKCIKCEQDVWIGKALQKQKVDGVICQECIGEFKTKLKEPEFIITSEVVHELINHLNSIVIDNLYCEIKHKACKHVNPQNNAELAYEKCSGEYCE